MGKCIVFCAAAFEETVEPITAQDYVIAADGGLLHTKKLGITPQAVLGDFDSLGYIPTDSQVFPVEKDDTDAMLAVRHGLKLGYREFLLYGSLDGPRLDHTVANFQTLQFLCDHGSFGMLAGLQTMAAVVKNGTLEFPAGCSGNISVFCMGADAAGVTLKGLYYPLENGTLRAGFPLGVSNHFTGEAASVQVEQGSLLVIWDRQNSLPQTFPYEKDSTVKL